MRVENFEKWLNKQVKPTLTQNEYKPRIKIQSTVDEGKGMSFNEKAEHIFKQIKEMK